MIKSNINSENIKIILRFHYILIKESILKISSPWDSNYNTNHNGNAS